MKKKQSTNLNGRLLSDGMITASAAVRETIQLLTQAQQKNEEVWGSYNLYRNLGNAIWVPREKAAFGSCKVAEPLAEFVVAQNEFIDPKWKNAYTGAIFSATQSKNGLTKYDAYDGIKVLFNSKLITAEDKEKFIPHLVNEITTTNEGNIIWQASELLSNAAQSKGIEAEHIVPLTYALLNPRHMSGLTDEAYSRDPSRQLLAEIITPKNADTILTTRLSEKVSDRKLGIFQDYAFQAMNVAFNDPGVMQEGRIHHGPSLIVDLAKGPENKRPMAIITPGEPAKVAFSVDGKTHLMHEEYRGNVSMTDRMTQLREQQPDNFQFYADFITKAQLQAMPEPFLDKTQRTVRFLREWMNGLRQIA